jgi:flagellar motility protein MotE (MotC chaperone)
MRPTRRRARRSCLGPPRLLPLVIVAASAALVVRLDGIGQHLRSLANATVIVAEAQADDGPGRDVVPLAPSAGGTATEPAEEPASPPAPPAPTPPPDEEQATTAESAQADAARLSPAEIEVLQQLADRRSQLVSREREIADRSVLLEAAEARIDQKVTELKELRATLEGLVSAFEAQEDTKIRSLVKIYETMKPRDAARIFEELEMDTLLLVADRMKDRSLAPIMANLNPAKAKEVTVELARLRQLPAEFQPATASQ